MYVIKEPPKIILAATGVQGEGGGGGEINQVTLS